MVRFQEKRKLVIGEKSCIFLHLNLRFSKLKATISPIYLCDKVVISEKCCCYFFVLNFVDIMIRIFMNIRCLNLEYSYFEKGCRKKCTRQSRKVLWVVLSSLFFKQSQDRMAGEAMDLCLRVLKGSNKSRFDSYSVREQCIDHIPYHLSGLSRTQFFRQPFSK